MKIISCRYLVTFILLFNLLCLSNAFSDTKKFDSKSMEFSSASFNDFFELKEIIKLSQKKILIGSIRELKTDKDGNIWILDSKKYEIKSYSKSGNFRFVLGNRGSGPGEFLRPIDFFITEKNIYVTDPMLRRLHVFDKNNLKYKYFFKIRDGRKINVIKDEEIILTAPLLINKKKGAKGGYNCLHIYNSRGDLLKSFFPINENARINKLICDGTYICIDKNNHIYGIQEMEYKIYKYTIDGQLLKTFYNENSINYIPPPKKPFQKTFLRSKAMEWINSWTHVMGIYVFEDFIFVYLYNNRENYGYTIDVFKINGEFFKGDLGTNFRLLHIDNQGILYFLHEIIELDSDITFSILKYGLKNTAEIAHGAFECWKRTYNKLLPGEGFLIHRGVRGVRREVFYFLL